MNDAAHALAASSLFATLPKAILADVGRLMRPVEFEPAGIVYREGQPGDHLILVESGRLEAWLSTPGGGEVRLSAIGPGEVTGELALLGDGRRTATIRAIERSRGWLLDRRAFELLRVSGDTSARAAAVAGVIGRLTVERLDTLYRRTAAELSGEPPSADVLGSPPKIIEPAADEGAYLPTIRFFEHFHPADIDAVAGRLPRLALVRGELLAPAGEPPRALWIVVRGAVETTIRGSTLARRMRLAGPGRAVGHCGLLGPRGSNRRVESRARERAVLIELSWARVDELLAGDDETSHAFAAALWTDTVRALQHGERPLAQMSLARSARTVIA